MRISRLRLIGFKSFTEPTELVVQPGLTGVVGPNGCGKSNLLEALRWVMGESSHKSMRAASMNDVIFSGTNNRPSRNWAEVTMYLDNTERSAPSDYNDTDVIEITRRIERDAGSAYRINGREARARDVKILFEDAATGARSPALVRQGQIGDIVNAKPEARRRILEDAAGISGLHSRRHDAELRLNAAQRNLTRLDDVLGGLNGQIESLKRQARQARRYKDVSQQVRATQALAMHLGWRDAQALLDHEDQELTQLVSTLGSATQQEARTLIQENELSEKLQPLREIEAKNSAVFGRLKVETENFEREAQRTMSRANELDERTKQLERDIAREENFGRESSEIITRLEAEIRQNTALSETAHEATDAAKEDVAKAEKTLHDSEHHLSEMTTRHAVENARRTNQEATLAETTKAIARLEAQFAKIQSDSEEIVANAPAAENFSKASQANLLQVEKISNVERDTSTAEEQVRTLEADLKTKHDNATQVRLSFNTLTTERETLAKLLMPSNDGDYPAIVDSLSVTPGYETALGAALGDDLDAPTADDAAVRWTDNSGSKTKAATDSELPKTAQKLSDVVQGPPELSRRLAQIGVVEKSQGLSLQSQLRPGQRLVSREGDLWRWDGFIAASEGTTASAQRLAQRNRMMALAHEEVALKETLEAHVKEEQTCLTKLTNARDSETQLRTNWRELQTGLAKLRDELAAVERASNDSQRQLAALNASQTRCQQDLDEGRTNAKSITDALKASGGRELEELTTALDNAKTSTQDLRSQTAKKQALLAGLEREHQMRCERLEAQSTELKSWRQRALSASEQAKALKSRQKETLAELETLSDLPAKMEARRQTLFDSLDAADNERKNATDNVALAETALKTATTALRELQGALSEAREQRARVEARMEATRERMDEDAQRIRDTLGVEPNGCLALAELPDETELPARHDVEQRLARLKADRERLGGVNLQADDELGELTSQRDTIESDRADVEQAIAKLRGGISQLNREGRRRLNEAFETVDGHFKRLFASLFNGGEARLEMVQSDDDPLAGGLEIIAKPPGKKPATLSLLSGGEQTLTALSLIFAVFLTNPSPICVLDEVDAPLDDSNVERFCNMMDTMALETKTRFLVITHHPMTMTRMNRLFGVTMAEQGISQLVSVDLETAQGFREAS